MELKELIERAEKAAGGQKALAIRIGQDAGNIRGAKAGLKGLPDYACVIIAQLIGESPITVIAASNLVTEKKEERREVWRPFVARAASYIIAIVLTVVTTVVTPSPAQAAQMTQVVDSTVYIMSNERSKRKGSQEYCEPFEFWWAVQVSNLSPLPCEGSALPLS